MPVKLDLSTNAKTEARFHPIVLSEEVNFDFQIRPPNFGELVADAERPFGFLQKRIDACLVGWRHVVDDDGKPIDFTSDNFKALCVQYPAALQMLAVTLGTFYLTGMKDTEESAVSIPNDNDSNPED